MEGRWGAHPTLAPACVRARVCPCESVFVPKWNNAFPLKGMCHPLLVWAERVAVTAVVTSTEGKGIFPVWVAPISSSWIVCIFITHSHVQTRTRLIGLLQCVRKCRLHISAKWNHLVGKPRHPHVHSYPRHRLSAHLSPASSYPTFPDNLPAHSGAAEIRLQIHVSVTSFLSDFISFYFGGGRTGGRTGRSDSESLCVHLKCFTGLMGFQK